MVDRRLLLAGVGAVALLAGLRWFQGNDVEAAGAFEVQKSDSEWRGILTKAQYEVLRLHRTETPGSSPLNHEKRKGIFSCAACALPLFSSETKYDSKTGWPSFYAPLRERHRHRDRSRLAAAAHRGALPPLRWPSRPRLRGRAAADRTALLHQRRRAEFCIGRAGVRCEEARRNNFPYA